LKYLSEFYAFSQGQIVCALLTGRLSAVWKIRFWLSIRKRTRAKYRGLSKHTAGSLTWCKILSLSFQLLMERIWEDMPEKRSNQLQVVFNFTVSMLSLLNLHALNLHYALNSYQCSLNAASLSCLFCAATYALSLLCVLWCQINNNSDNKTI